jgi:hypothetical protein
MRMLMEGRRPRRLAAALGAIAAMMAVGLSTAAPAHAAFGGDVIRHDGIRDLIIAKDIRNYNAGYGSNCAIWNWGGGNTWNYTNPGNNCRTLSMNGHTYSWTQWWDTDAFTLQYEAYWLNMHGSWRRLAANTYTKIEDHENAHCYRESDGVNCYVSYG